MTRWLSVVGLGLTAETLDRYCYGNETVETLGHTEIGDVSFIVEVEDRAGFTAEAIRDRLSTGLYAARIHATYEAALTHAEELRDRAVAEARSRAPRPS